MASPNSGTSTAKKHTSLARSPSSADPDVSISTSHWWLHETATTPSMGYLLGMTDQMPTLKETLNTDLHVWFFPKWKVPILRWDPQAGCQRTTVPT